MPAEKKAEDLFVSKDVLKKLRRLKNWHSKNSSDEAVELLSLMGEALGEFNKAIKSTEDFYECKQKESYKKKDAAIALIEKNKDRDVALLEKEFDEELKKLELRKAEVLAVADNNTADKKKQTRVFGVIENAVEKLFGDAASFSNIFSSKSDAKNTRERFLQAYKIHRERRIDYYNSRYDKIIADAKKAVNNKKAECNKEITAIISQRDIALRETAAQYADILYDILDKEKLTEYKKGASRSYLDADSFSCPTSVPERISLGSISGVLVRKKNCSRRIYEIISALPAEIISETADEFRITLPYYRFVDDGVSLQVRFPASEREHYKRVLQMIILKLFAFMPAGKLEATFIDPVELGDTFSMFAKLGSEKAHITGGKIWSQEKDIENVMSVLRSKFEAMTLAYGSEPEARKKKEPYRVLAVTDFPSGFTCAALKDLHAIVRNSAQYGLSVLIWSQNEEEVIYDAEKAALCNEIRRMLPFAQSSGRRRLDISTASEGSVILALEPVYKNRSKVNGILDIITDAIHNSSKKVEHFSDMFTDMKNSDTWFRKSSLSELALPLGINGANTVVKMIMGKSGSNTAHHALIAGQTGAGKSTALNTIIMSALINYSPDELQLYLVDFKEGVEFKVYSDYVLPSIRTVAVDCEREFGLNVLREAHREMKRRYDMFKREASREDIEEYRNVTGKKLPRILVIFDEIQELFRGKAGDSVSSECEILLGELLTLGRAAGIHFILASQNFNLIPAVKGAVFSHCGIRVAIKGSEESVNSVLGDGNCGAKQLDDGASGLAIYNCESGKESANTVFQISYLQKDKRRQLLEEISRIQTKMGYKADTRILLTSAEDGNFNCYNRLINENVLSGASDNVTSFYVGEGFEMRRDFLIKTQKGQGQNILLVGNDENKALSICTFSVLGAVLDYAAAHNKLPEKPIVDIIDLSQDYITGYGETTDFSYIARIFPHFVKRAALSDMKAVTDNVYSTLERRMNGTQSCDEKRYFVFFGVDRAHRLTQDNMYEDDDCNSLSSVEKLKAIIRSGADYGIHCIFWGESLKGITEKTGDDILKNSSHRIAFSTDNDTLAKTVYEFSPETVQTSSALYMDVENFVKNIRFRPFELPHKEWVKKIADRINDGF